MKEEKIQQRNANVDKIQDFKTIFNILEKHEGNDDSHQKYRVEIEELTKKNKSLDNHIVGLEKACVILNQHLKREREDENEPGCSNTLLGAGGKKRKITPNNPINVIHHTPRWDFEIVIYISIYIMIY